MAHLEGKDEKSFCLMGTFLKRYTFAQFGEYYPSDYITYDFKKYVKLN